MDEYTICPYCEERVDKDNLLYKVDRLMTWSDPEEWHHECPFCFNELSTDDLLTITNNDYDQED